MKVRLKPKGSDDIYMFHEFQFHEGPIKANFFVMGDKNINLFQFHEGPIKARTFEK